MIMKSISIDKRLEGIIKELLMIFIPVATCFILVKYVVMIAVVQSSSMEPTLMTGNTVVYNRLAYNKHDIQRGDVVIFWSDEANCYLGKRVIGLPNDNIKFRDGYVVINNQYFDESEYIKDNTETNCNKEFTVPTDCYFMLGDNRENSLDARYWNSPYIHKDKIIGKYMGQINFSIQYDILHDY